VFNVVVEITKGSKVKYELDKKTGMIKVRSHPSPPISFASEFKTSFPFVLA
jgi:inorganic pyrophosphatase